MKKKIIALSGKYYLGVFPVTIGQIKASYLHTNCLLEIDNSGEM
jgi:hypothetical protein